MANAALIFNLDARAYNFQRTCNKKRERGKFGRQLETGSSNAPKVELCLHLF